MREEEFILDVEMVSVSVGGLGGKLPDSRLGRDPVVSPSKASRETSATRGKKYEARDGINMQLGRAIG